jgi:hypothetical protein
MLSRRSKIHIAGRHVTHSCWALRCLLILCTIVSQDFLVQGSEIIDMPPMVDYAIHVIRLSQEDRHNLRLDSNHTVKPSVHDNSRVSFELPPHCVIRSAHLLLFSVVIDWILKPHTIFGE